MARRWWDKEGIEFMGAQEAADAEETGETEG